MKNIKLNNNTFSQFSQQASIPQYDRSKVKTGIVHVGIGGFHRAHEAFYTDQLLHKEALENWGICGVALLDFDTKIYNTLQEQDGLYTLIVKELDGSHTRHIIGSIVECLFAPENPKQVIEKMASEEVKIISLTITEGGYNYNEATKQFDFTNPLIIHDLENPQAPKTIFGYLTQALKLRKERGLKGITIQSCDNIQGNGHMTQNMLLSYVAEAAPELVDWIDNNVSFPNAMVDRITPVTAPEDISYLKETTGIDDAWPVVCEPFKQWVIEDNFIAGRPAWEKVGAQFVEDVVPYEKMKLSLLNAGHSVIGLLGALVGYNTIDEAINNTNIRTFLNHYMDVEVTPTLGDLEGINLHDYKQSLLERFGNINIKDQIDRICSETSAKFPIFILPTINNQLANKGAIELAAFVTAAWAIYSFGEDEKGNPLAIKDALKTTLQSKAIEAQTKPVIFLEIDSVFGDLNTNSTFVNSYTKAYKDIQNKGVEACVITLNNKYDKTKA
ncbi:mannitol dehydrogenase family protein [Polaribacter sp. Asnod6-C07]|uniref:mannitol dehydrogenase family protein n=1 Tax=Polaribacter sp. Asnod6-C07 TaxID=3160582 RepID=UPI00386F9CA8